MLSNRQIAEYLIQRALKEKSRGKKQAARSLAQHAISLAPELEEPWLILAALANPRASLEYYQEALKINPESQRARQGLYDAENWLQKTNRFLAQQNTSPRSSDKGYATAIKRLGMILVSGMLVFVILAVIFVISQNGIAKGNDTTSTEQNFSTLLPASTASSAETPSPAHTPTIMLSPTPVIIPVATATTIASQPASLQPTDPSVVINPLATLPSTYLPGDKHIVVNITEQHLYAYQGNALAFSFTISSGADNSTSIGTFSVLDKNPLAYSAPWGFWMPDWLGIYWVGDLENGIHALPVLPDGSIIWGDSLGTPASHGCVVLDTADARLLYDWADIGTQVVIER